VAAREQAAAAKAAVVNATPNDPDPDIDVGTGMQEGNNTAATALSARGIDGLKRSEKSSPRGSSAIGAADDGVANGTSTSGRMDVDTAIPAVGVAGAAIEVNDVGSVDGNDDGAASSASESVSGGDDDDDDRVDNIDVDGKKVQIDQEMIAVVERARKQAIEQDRKQQLLRQQRRAQAKSAVPAPLVEKQKSTRAAVVPSSFSSGASTPGKLRNAANQTPVPAAGDVGGTTKLSGAKRPARVRGSDTTNSVAASATLSSIDVSAPSAAAVSNSAEKPKQKTPRASVYRSIAKANASGSQDEVPTTLGVADSGLKPSFTSPSVAKANVADIPRQPFSSMVTHQELDDNVAAKSSAALQSLRSLKLKKVLLLSYFVSNLLLKVSNFTFAFCV
jgi:hypothetical protein